MCFASGSELPFHFIRVTLNQRTDTDIIHTLYEMYIVFDAAVHNCLQSRSEKDPAEPARCAGSAVFGEKIRRSITAFAAVILLPPLAAVGRFGFLRFSGVAAGV